MTSDRVWSVEDSRTDFDGVALLPTAGQLEMQVTRCQQAETTFYPRTTAHYQKTQEGTGCKTQQ